MNEWQCIEVAERVSSKLPVSMLGFGDDCMSGSGGGSQGVVCGGLFPVEGVGLFNAPPLHAALKQS